MGHEVTDYISTLKQAWQIPVCSKLREVVLQAIPGATERIQYGKPHFLKNGKYACVISPSKAAISFTIFNASSLDNPIFEPGDSPERKTIKIKDGQSVDYALLGTLIQQAAAGL